MAARTPRVPLSRERVLAGAMAVADQGGLNAVTMRGVADELGCEAMSLYYYVKDKSALLDGLVEVVIDEILAATEADDALASDEHWLATVRRRCLTARAVMLRHPWAPTVFSTHENIPPNSFFVYELLVGTMVRAGFDYDLAHRAIHSLGSMVLGFTQELFDPEPGESDEVDLETFERMAAAMPYLTGMAAVDRHDPDSSLSRCDTQSEFEFTLTLILEGLERFRLDGE